MSYFDFISLGLTPSEFALHIVQTGLSAWDKIPSEKRPFFLLTAHLFLSLNEKDEDAKKVECFLTCGIFDLVPEKRLEISKALAGCQIPEFAAFQGGYLCGR